MSDFVEEEDFLIIFRVWTRDVDHLLHTPTQPFFQLNFQLGFQVKPLISATIVSSLSNLEGEEVFEASSLGQCDYVGQERISDDELIIIKGSYYNSRQANLVILFRTKSAIIRINHCPWCKLFHVWRNWKINSRCSLCCQARIWIQVSRLRRWLCRSCSFHFLGKLRRQVNSIRTSVSNSPDSAWAAANNWLLQNSHNVSKSFQKH